MSQKIGLVLEGGGMRGSYTAGVLDGMIDAGIVFPYCIGVSAGACNALSYIAKQRGRYYHAVTDYLRDKRYMGWYSLMKTGYFFGNRFVFDDIAYDLVPLDFVGLERELPNWELRVVTTDCLTGKPCYDRITELSELPLVEGSSSLPLVSPVLHYRGRLLMDGGVSDSIPIRRAEEDGCEKNVVILTRDASYQKNPSRTASLVRLRYPRYPKLAEALARRHEEYNRALAEVLEREKAGAAFVIRPGEPVAIGRMERDVQKITALYESGLRDIRAMLPALRQFLAEQPVSVI